MKISQLWAVLALACSPFFAAAQGKIGHMNLGNLLASMPESGKADSTLMLYRAGLVAEGDTLVKAFEKEYKAYEEAYQAGTISKIEGEKREAALNKMQSTIQAYAQQVDEKVETLRRQLLAPILTRVEDAIQSVGKEGQYVVIFDTSTGDALYAADSEDITPLVKAKLGLK